MHFGAGLVVLVFAFICFARGWIGGGDAKLAAATALWLGFDLLMPYLLYASLLGGVLTILIIRFRIDAAAGAGCRGIPGSRGSTKPMPACPTASRSLPPRCWSIRPAR